MTTTHTPISTSRRLRQKALSAAVASPPRVKAIEGRNGCGLRAPQSAAAALAHQSAYGDNSTSRQENRCSATNKYISRMSPWTCFECLAQFCSAQTLMTRGMNIVIVTYCSLASHGDILYRVHSVPSFG